MIGDWALGLIWGIRERGLVFGIGIGDWDLGLGLAIWIGDWDWGL